MLLVKFILFYVIYYFKFYVCVFPWEKKGRKNWANKPMKKKTKSAVVHLQITGINQKYLQF